MNRIQQLLDQSGVHEHVPAPLDRRVAVAASAAGISLVASVLGHALVFANLDELLRAGVIWLPALWVGTLGGYSHWLFVVTCTATGLAAGLAITTGGFRAASKAELWGLALVIVVGVVAPLPLVLGGLVAMVTIMTVVFLVLYVMFCLALVIGAAGRR